jgi:5-(carboxyamino)imidazole ribonucleotide mutase
MKDVLVIMGSESDRAALEPGFALLADKAMSFEVRVFSAHRSLEDLLAFLKQEGASFRVIIAAAGLAAALPGIVASQVTCPVIGVPLATGVLSGVDAFLSIAQLPRGVPVATMGLGPQGIHNAVLLAERIIRVGAGR